MPASTSSVPFEGVKTREASLRVSLDVPASRRQTPSTARSDVTSSRPVFNNVLGKLPTTLWQIADQFTPKGLALEVSGDLDEADGHAVYEAAILGDAVAVAQALGVPPPLGKEEEGAAADEAVVPATAQRGPWHVSDAFGIEPLAHAADAGHAAVVKVLLGAAADPRAKCACDGTTALHRAAKSGHSAIVDLLVAHSAAVNEPAGENATPLHLAAMGGHSDAIKSLLTAGADVEAYDATGTTPLMAAAQSGSAEAVAAILDAGGRLDAVDENGWAALHFACESRNHAVASLLMKSGAQLGTLTRGGRALRDIDLATAELLGSSAT